MDLGLKGRTALVCGSSQGLGRATAEILLAEGASVVINGRDPEKLGRTRDELAAATGGTVHAAPADLTDAKAIEHLVASAREKLGPLDILVTNTGGPPSGLFESHDEGAWKTAIANNLESVVRLVRGALPDMKERRWGRIVNITSITVKQPVGGLILSNTVRAGVTGFAKTISNEAAPFGVTCNCVGPGYTRTQRLVDLAEANSARTGAPPEDTYAAWEAEIPMARLGEPREVASLIVWLCSEQAAYVTGQTVMVDGGWTKGLL